MRTVSTRILAIVEYHRVHGPARHARGGPLNGFDDTANPVNPHTAPVPSAAVLLGATPVRVYKHDKRSKVWEVVVEGERYVIKRFEHSLFKQRFVRWLGRHPAQRERRVTAKLARDGLAVVPILAHGVDRGRSWLATRWTGESAQNLLRPGVVTDAVRRARCCLGVAELWVRLFEKGWFFRDFQTANIVFDVEDHAVLIDAGSARRSRRRDLALRLLHRLDRTATHHSATRTDRLRVRRAVMERVNLPELDAE